MKRQVFLVGYRATGKSTIGKELASAINWKFVDLDKEIEMLSSKSIRKIFEEDGEDKFRELETEALRCFSKEDKVVISTGGGVVIKEENRRIMENGFVVLIESSMETIIKRMKADSSRPPLTTLTLEEEVKKTISERKPFYEKVYHIKVINENISIESLVQLIKNSLPFNLH
ncbi:MAG: shikimate kinase [Brevinematia bacterium]